MENGPALGIQRNGNVSKVYTKGDNNKVRIRPKSI